MSRLSTLVTRAAHDVCCSAIRAALERTLKAREPLTASQWADANFYLSPESSGQEGPWTTQPHQVAILDLMGADEPRIVDLRKSARVGYTKCLVAATCYRLEHKRRNVAHFQPIDSDANEFCKAEIDPAIRDVPVMQALFDESSNKKRDDTLKLKKFGNRFLYIRGGNAASRYRRITADYVDYDELDGFDREIGTEGDPLVLGDRAIRNSSFPRSFRGSTPSNKYDSLIQQEVENASLLFEYFVACPECKHMQPFTWSGFKWLPEKEGRTKEERAESVVFECSNCSVPWDYREIWPLLKSGAWRSDDGHEIITGDHEPILHDPSGLVIDWPRHIALFVWAAYSTFASWSEMVHEWLDAQGNVLKLKTFINHWRGEVWGDDADEVDENELFARREAYGIPDDVLLMNASIDIQDTWAEILVTGYTRTEKAYFIDFKPFYDLTDSFPSAVYDDMEEFILNARYTRNDGQKFRISAVGVDTGHHTAQAYLFVARLNRKMKRAYALKGKGGDRPIVTLPGSKQETLTGEEIILYTVGVDWSKRVITNRLKSHDRHGNIQPSRIELNLEFTQEMCEQLTAEKLVTTYSRGFAVRKWVKTADRNEQLDLWGYSLAALYIQRPNWSALERNLGAKRKKTKRKSKPAVVDQVDQQHRTSRRRRRSRASGRSKVTTWGHDA